MRILLIYPGHSHSTIDVAIGYEKALRQLGHEVYAYNYHLSLSFYEKALEWWQNANPKFSRADGDYLMLASERVAVETIDFIPDVALIVCGMALHRRAYELLYKLCVPYVILFTESPYQDETQITIAKKTASRGALVNDKTSVGTFGRFMPEAYPVEYLPHSFDTDRHKPNGKVDKEIDAFFFGTLWPERQVIFGDLEDWGKARDYHILLGGITPDEIHDQNVKDKFKDNAELVDYYHKSKIAINHNRTVVGVWDNELVHIRNAYSLGPRAYEIAACGAFQLCDDARPELRQVFDKSVATYSGRQQLQERIDYYLRHDDEREDMAQESLERVQSCSFYWRAKEILVPFIKEVI